MSSMNTILRRGATLAAAALLLAACDDSTSPPPRATLPVVRIALSTSLVQMLPGDGHAVSALPLGEGDRPLTDRAVTWRSDDPAVARVDAEGRVSAEGVGTTLVHASAGGKEASLRVDVLAAGTVARVVVGPPVQTLAPGESSVLYGMAYDASQRLIQGRPTRWRSSDPNVARVSEGGRVLAEGPGRARITAEVDGREGSMEVEVADLARVPSPEGSWTMRRLGDATVPAAYRVFLDQELDGRRVGRVEIRLDSATKTIGLDGRYTRRYWFSEWHDGALFGRYGWSDRGWWVQDRDEATGVVAITMHSTWIQNLSTTGAVQGDGMSLREQLWHEEPTEHTVWVRRP